MDYCITWFVAGYSNVGLMPFKQDNYIYLVYMWVIHQRQPTLTWISGMMIILLVFVQICSILVLPLRFSIN